MAKKHHFWLGYAEQYIKRMNQDETMLNTDTELSASESSNNVNDKYFKMMIASVDEAPPVMPLVHTCDCFTLRNIVNSKLLEPSLCPVFNENLVYYFYGRPSYRLGDKGLAFNTSSVYPACFIIDPTEVNVLTRIFPFDSGAYAAGLYEKHIHKKAKKEDYQFETSYEFIQKFVKFFYDSNSNYFDGKTTIQRNEIQPCAYELESIYSLINTPHGEQFDDRCYTIEIQSSAPTQIDGKSLRAIVIPDSIAADEVLASFLYDNEIEAITYTTTRVAPSQLTPLVIAKVRDFYLNKGVIQ